MNQLSTPALVKEALAHRLLYQNSESFNLAISLFAECEKVDVSTLDSIVNTFLTNRKILPDADEEVLLQMGEADVRLMGTTYYFVRKFFTTTYDLPENSNPIKLIDNVFGSLYVSGNDKAAKVLRELAELSSKDSPNQQRIVRIADEMVTYIMTKHQEALNKVKSSRKAWTTAYDTEIAAANRAHNVMVDKIVEYARDVITYQRRPSIKPFMNFLGINT